MKGKGENIYFIGIGGIGMSALARFYKSAGNNVAGYDKTPSLLTSELIAEGIDVSSDDNPASLPFDPDVVIFTPAIPSDNKILNYLKSSGAAFMKRAQALGNISKDVFTVAVAGTHGKTTITSIVAHILKSSGKKVTAFVGGICNNYNSNLILSHPTEIIVAEADEFDRSFLTLHPDIAVISSMDADHLDIYGNKDYLEESFFLFSRQIKNGGLLIINDGLKTADNLNVDIVKYSVGGETEVSVNGLRIENGITKFTLNIDKTNIEIETFLPGIHNASNIAAAVAVCFRIGISGDEISSAIADYKGVKRRFDVRVKNNDTVYIDDYAHHPKEIEATVTAVKELYPDKKLTVVFQPHLYSRTRDFADDFAKALSLADEVMLMEIYPAREKPIEGINSNMLLKKIECDNKQIVGFDNVADIVAERKPEILLTLGAGDIDRIVKPIEEVLR